MWNDMLQKLFAQTGFSALTWQHGLMLFLALVLAFAPGHVLFSPFAANRVFPDATLMPGWCGRCAPLLKGRRESQLGRKPRGHSNLRSPQEERQTSRVCRAQRENGAEQKGKLASSIGLRHFA
jgi:hypothetical protein